MGTKPKERRIGVPGVAPMGHCGSRKTTMYDSVKTTFLCGVKKKEKHPGPLVELNIRHRNKGNPFMGKTDKGLLKF